ncbi:MAG TPA: hypothetical protein VLS88_00150, partial [Polyangiales bacterium]|nr:hypothetical protein [Polyangiales bacterium]
LNIFAFVFCVVLFIKGHLAPTGPDQGSSGNPIFDFYWGMELYPHILGWDVKHFTNCRFGMMGWVLLLLCFADAQIDAHGSLATSMWVSLGLQFLYLTQFYWRESGYFYTMDVRVDRAGFYLVWGCIVWIPAVYTLVAGYLVMHPVELAWTVAVAIGLIGALAILSKNDANRQRLETRKTDGETTIWGKSPRVIRANYTDADGQERESLLLASGWWGIARHFHYTGEIIGAFCWSVVAGFQSWVPYVYVIYLTVLLIHRTHRDEKKNRRKYGEDWEKYRRIVPWRLIPGLY